MDYDSIMNHNDEYIYTEKSYLFLMGLYETCYIITGDDRFDVDEYSQLSDGLVTFLTWWYKK